MSGAPPQYGILVHCHLRWDFVWQRPQHVISRLSKRHPILFLEDAAPLPDGEDTPRMQLTEISPTLTVARPLLMPHNGDPEHDREADKINGPAWKRLLDESVTNVRAKDPGNWQHLVQWFYTPMAAGARNFYDPIGVTYDCMDELANFKGAPTRLKQQEHDLMNACDVMFTGGASMYAARKDRFSNIHLMQSGVDVQHFQTAQDDATRVPDDMAALPTPRLLYYGVIDERMGWDNIAALCDAHPDWSVMMVGPLAKITEADLLRRPNLHYTGQRGYETLPGYLKGCDVALVPFAMSEATLYLSPTKTLEYFAARKPVVSTPIKDIVDYYQNSARVASTPEEFVQACEAALDPGLAGENTVRLDEGERWAAKFTWDSIVGQMGDLLDAAVARKLAP